jgi:hypothetical protein
MGHHSDNWVYRTALATRKQKREWFMSEICTLCDSLIHLFSLGVYSGNCSWNYRFNGVFFGFKTADYEELHRGRDVIT